MIVALLLLCTSAAATSYLGVAKTSFEFNGSPVFLSGANQAWIQYGADFGNNQTGGEACALQASIRSAQHLATALCCRVGVQQRGGAVLIGVMSDRHALRRLVVVGIDAESCNPQPHLTMHSFPPRRTTSATCPSPAATPCASGSSSRANRSRPSPATAWWWVRMRRAAWRRTCASTYATRPLRMSSSTSASGTGR